MRLISTTSSMSWKMRWCWSRGAPTAGVFRHELLRRSPVSWRRRVAGVAPRWAMPGPAVWAGIGLAAGRRPLRAGRAVRPGRRGVPAGASAEALRRGALAEARTYLNRAISHLDRVTPGSDRDRRDPPALGRGMLTAAAEVPEARSGGRRHGRCLQLGGTDPSDDELFAALGTPVGLLRHALRLCRSGSDLRVAALGFRATRPWGVRDQQGGSGVVAFLRRRAGRAARRPSRNGKRPELRPMTESISHASPFDQYGAPRVPLALVHVVRGNLSGAER